ITSRQPLAGWLYLTTRHQALNLSRAEGRRRQREQTAAAMQTPQHSGDPTADQINDELEAALDTLPAE
ncbi:MAG TPA: hypothetical protein DCY13_13055, partial [Verrucomicrobiales bacterium]|nr:hypothetical protein [Verrucomicrobiales bacterium]